MSEKEHILVNRLRKVERLALVCQEVKITSDIVPQLTDEQWAMLARLSQVNPPSAETKALLVHTLALREERGTKAKEQLEKELLQQVQKLKDGKS